MQVTYRCADLSLKMHQKFLAAGLHPDPLGELTKLSQTAQLYLRIAVGRDKRGGRERQEGTNREGQMQQQRQGT